MHYKQFSRRIQYPYLSTTILGLAEDASDIEKLSLITVTGRGIDVSDGDKAEGLLVDRVK